MKEGKLKKRTRDHVTVHTAGSKSCRASGRTRREKVGAGL